MIILNFSHPLTPAHLTQLESLTGQIVERVIVIQSQVDVQQPLAPQITMMVEAAALLPTEWQTLPLLVNPPALNFSALLLLAELHGRCGYFPPCLRLRPIAGPDGKPRVPRQYEVAEVLDLQTAREAGRKRRE